ncbi:hypothetical protein N0V86_006329 [Didymella sp. IMI 355093]|nr:hypothetical protein N0V86_006329 [Didymella sp. IMI 355093]
MSTSTGQRKFYLAAPGLEFRMNGPIKIGNVITDLMAPQDPIAFFEPLAKIINGSPFGEGRVADEHRASAHADFAAKLSNIFGAQAGAVANSSSNTMYEFDRITAKFLETNPTAKDAKAFRLKDEEFRNALRVYIVTGLKIARGLKYAKQRASGHGASVEAGGHVTQEVAVKGDVGVSSSGEQIDSFTVLGDTILAYRLHVIKKKRAVFGEGKVTVESYVPKAGLMGEKEELDSFDGEPTDILLDDVDEFSKQQYVEVEYLDLGDEDEEWTMAVLEA